MKKLIGGALSAVMGAALAVMLHCSFMLVEIEGSDMLPDFEPGQKALVFLLSDGDDIEEGDMVAFSPDFYQVGAGGNPVVRRVAQISEDGYGLVSDSLVNSGGEEMLTVSEEKLLGKVIRFD